MNRTPPTAERLAHEEHLATRAERDPVACLELAISLRPLIRDYAKRDGCQPIRRPKYFICENPDRLANMRRTTDVIEAQQEAVARINEAIAETTVRLVNDRRSREFGIAQSRKRGESALTSFKRYARRTVQRVLYRMKAELEFPSLDIVVGKNTAMLDLLEGRGERPDVLAARHEEWRILRQIITSSTNGLTPNQRAAALWHLNLNERRLQGLDAPTSREPAQRDLEAAGRKLRPLVLAAGLSYDVLQIPVDVVDYERKPKGGVPAIWRDHVGPGTKTATTPLLVTDAKYRRALIEERLFQNPTIGEVK